MSTEHNERKLALFADDRSSARHFLSIENQSGKPHRQNVIRMLFLETFIAEDSICLSEGSFPEFLQMRLLLFTTEIAVLVGVRAQRDKKNTKAGSHRNREAGELRFYIRSKDHFFQHQSHEEIKGGEQFARCYLLRIALHNKSRPQKKSTSQSLLEGDQKETPLV